jgi:large subunit ribosomal protein L21
MSYAIIAIGGKQHRVREGERLLVDRLAVEEGKVFHPEILMIGGDGESLLGAGELKGQQVTARVTAHVLGKKVIVGKHKQRTGYRRRNGMRPRLSSIQIESIGKRPTRAAKAAPAAEATPGAEVSAPKRAARARAAAQPKPEETAAPKRPARKPKAESATSDESPATPPRRTTRKKATEE